MGSRLWAGSLAVFRWDAKACVALQLQRTSYSIDTTQKCLKTESFTGLLLLPWVIAGSLLIPQTWPSHHRDSPILSPSRPTTSTPAFLFSLVPVLNSVNWFVVDAESLSSYGNQGPLAGGWPCGGAWCLESSCCMLSCVFWLLWPATGLLQLQGICSFISSLLELLIDFKKPLQHFYQNAANCVGAWDSGWCLDKVLLGGTGWALLWAYIWTSFPFFPLTS